MTMPARYLVLPVPLKEGPDDAGNYRHDVAGVARLNEMPAPLLGGDWSEVNSDGYENVADPGAEVERLVHRALDNTVVNGYDVGDPRGEAVELLQDDAEVEQAVIKIVEAHVVSWMEKQGS